MMRKKGEHENLTSKFSVFFYMSHPLVGTPFSRDIVPNHQITRGTNKPEYASETDYKREV